MPEECYLVGIKAKFFVIFCLLAFVMSVLSKQIVHSGDHQILDGNRKVGWFVGCFNPKMLNWG